VDFGPGEHESIASRVDNPLGEVEHLLGEVRNHPGRVYILFGEMDNACGFIARLLSDKWDLWSDIYNFLGELE
jgi:hypothetical protein